MDQPQQDDNVRNEETVDETVNTDQNVQVEVVETPPEDTQSVPVTVVEDTVDREAVSDDSMAQSEPSSEVESGESTDSTAEQPTESADVHAAQDMVADAAPMAATDELASVASELGAMGDEVQVDEGLPGAESASVEASPPMGGGSDPMDQIQADEQSAAASEPEHVPFTSGETTDAITMPDVSGDSTSAPASESPADMQVATEPQQDMPMAVEPNTSPEPASNFEAVSMANQAMADAEPTRNPGELINDVIAPTAVAAAVAEGTVGQNAITGTPETSSVMSSQNISTSPQPTKAKSKKGLLIAIVAIVTLLFGGAAVAAYMIRPKTAEKANTSTSASTADKAMTTEEMAAMEKEKATQSATPVTTTPAPGENVTAKALDDYKAACGGGTVSNASDYKGTATHPVVFFEQGSDSKYAMSVVAFKDKSWAADATKVTSGQLAVCVLAKAGSEKKIKSCPITDATTKVTTNVDYYSSTYTVNVYNAKTGAKVNSYESPSIVTECPTTAVYDKTNPKITAKYDLVSVETLIKPDVTKAL